MGDTGRGVAELRGHDHGFQHGLGWAGRHHATNGPGRLGQDHARQPVDARHIHHAGHHHNILHADIGRRVAASQRGDHELRKTHGQRAHGRRANGRAAATAQRDHSVDLSVALQPRQHQRSGASHQGHRLATIPASDHCGQVGTGLAGHLFARDLGLQRRRAERAHIDEQHRMPVLPDAIRHIAMLLPLRVKRP